jgi:DNA-directed RNA polymerase specialized sigma24 family protein
MAEMMVLLQALLLVAGWLLFLRAQTELRAQAARQSLTGELEELRRSVEMLLQRLTHEAEAAEARVQACIATLNRYMETSPADIGYNLSESETRSFGMVALLAQQGLSIAEIARKTGYAPGEVELILSLQRRQTEEEI